MERSTTAYLPPGLLEINSKGPAVKAQAVNELLQAVKLDQQLIPQAPANPRPSVKPATK